MRFLDLHAHPAVKTLFNDYTLWENIEVDDKLIGDIIESQSNFGQVIQNGTCNLICMTLSPIETGVLDQWLLKLVGPVISDEIFNPATMRQMISGELDYQKVLEEEKNKLTIPPQNPSATRPVEVLKNFKEYKREDLSRLYVIFNIEGGHTFYNARNHHTDLEQILRDFKKFVTGENLMVLYITPAHLTPNIFMTHAFACKILGKGAFLPKGCGITKEGAAFLEAIADTNVLVDVKHMSVVTRRIFYENSGWNPTHKPLLCSHAGLAGCSWNDRLNTNVVLRSVKPGPEFVKMRYNKPQGLLKETYFNPCSINLYDEDIVHILRSGGIIGIIMDMRILGGSRNVLDKLKSNEKEFISPQEFEIWKGDSAFAPVINKYLDFPYKRSSVEGEISDDVWDEEDRQDELEELIDFSENDFLNLHLKVIGADGLISPRTLPVDRGPEHLRFFVNQVFHIVAVAQKAQLKIDPWKHICIGSDFDGFIRAIDSCKNISHLSAFGESLIGMLPELKDEANGRGAAIELPRHPKALVEDILFNNAYDFISAHFMQQKPV